MPPGRWERRPSPGRPGERQLSGGLPEPGPSTGRLGFHHVRRAGRRPTDGATLRNLPSSGISSSCSIPRGACGCARTRSSTRRTVRTKQDSTPLCRSQLQCRTQWPTTNFGARSAPSSCEPAALRTCSSAVEDCPMSDTESDRGKDTSSAPGQFPTHLVREPLRLPRRRWRPPPQERKPRIGDSMPAPGSSGPSGPTPAGSGSAPSSPRTGEQGDGTGAPRRRRRGTVVVAAEVAVGSGSERLWSEQRRPVLG